MTVPELCVRVRIYAAAVVFGKNLLLPSRFSGRHSPILLSPTK